MLTSRETRLLNLRRDFNEQNQRRENRAVLLKLKHNGAPGAIIGTGFVLNVTTGYSSNFALVDPATSRSSKLAGADVRFGYADVTEGFPVGTKFRAPLVLGNVSTKPLRARVSVDYTLGGTPTSLGVGEERILPGELRVIELTEELARLGITGPVDDAGVDIIHDGAPGSLIAHLTSVDQTGDYSFEVPIKDPSETAHMSLNRYPWTLRDGTKTVLHLKNTTARTVGAQVEFRFLGGIYNRGRIQLQPFQTLAVDIQKLKDSGQKDAIGSVFPKQAMSGQVEWFEEMPKSIIGRAEQVNVAAGTARSFSCGTRHLCLSEVVGLLRAPRLPWIKPER